MTELQDGDKGFYYPHPEFHTLDGGVSLEPFATLRDLVVEMLTHIRVEPHDWPHLPDEREWPLLDDFADPRTAFGSCGQVSAAVDSWLLDVGFVVADVECSKLLEADRWFHDGHYASAFLSGDDWWAIDFTYRQFDPKSPFPLLEPLHTYLTRWDSTTVGTLTGVEVRSV